MAKGVSKLLAVALAGAGIWGAYRLGSDLLSGDEETESTRHVVNQVWLERMPASQRDMIGHLLIVDHPEGKVGIAGKSSQWRHFIEAFLWKLQGHRLSVYFPQEEARADLKVKSWRCEGEAPAPFQLCLEISNGRRTANFYSRDDWKIEPHHTAESLAEIAEGTPELAFVLDAISDERPIDAEGLDLESFEEADTLLTAPR